MTRNKQYISSDAIAVMVIVGLVAMAGLVALALVVSKRAVERFFVPAGQVQAFAKRLAPQIDWSSEIRVRSAFSLLNMDVIVLSVPEGSGLGSQGQIVGERAPSMSLLVAVVKSDEDSEAAVRDLEELAEIEFGYREVVPPESQVVEKHIGGVPVSFSRRIVKLNDVPTQVMTMHTRASQGETILLFLSSSDEAAQSAIDRFVRRFL